MNHVFSPPVLTAGVGEMEEGRAAFASGREALLSRAFPAHVH